ncbi:MAG TPA: imidazole glycerol phosphate synthase subunit HisH [Terriglobales bacterium]|jgi:glutamine amidotransferase|nr:imidazole glycerol phosphate synthase subunit HisH [Terriglobales bacterium]
MLKKVGVVSYGLGNLRSVCNALSSLGASPFIAERPAELPAADAVILPGVGAFGDGMNNLRAAGWVEILEQEVRQKGKPFLGICLGMQLLATSGTEHGTHPGLGWVSGVARRICPGDPGLRLPHIGWNDVQPRRAGKLFTSQEPQAFYFVHGYILAPEGQAKEAVTATCMYGEEFAATLEQGNILATQFHPEKSQRAGLDLLRRFLECDGAAC